MASEIMDQRHVLPLYVPPVSSSFFADEIRFPAQRHVGFWKSEMVTDNLVTQGSLFDQSIRVNSNLDEDEIFEPLKEIEAQTIGNLLPDDDELFSGVIDDFGVEHVSPANNTDFVEDDIFYSGGGMELDANNVPNGYHTIDKTIFGGEYVLSAHPSRALFVNNIEKSIDDNDLKVLFKRHGDIQMLYSTCKHRGFIIICYYDLRAACTAMREFQNKLVMHQKLDLYFVMPKVTSSVRNIYHRIILVSNLDSSVSKDHLYKIFGVHGEIKEIHEIPQNWGQNFVEFYDIRASEDAFRTLNGSYIAGKRVQLELVHPELASQLMQKSSYETKQEEVGLFLRKGNPPNSLPSAYYGRIPFGAVKSGSLDNSTFQGQLSTHGPVSSHMKYAFNEISSCGPHYQSSPVTVGHIGSHSNQRRMDGLDISLGQMNYGLKCVPSFRHSLPDYHNGLTDGVPSHPPKTISSTSLNFIAHSDRVDTMHVPEVNSGGLSCPSFLCNEQGSSNGISQGHQDLWNSHRSQRHCPPGHLMWQNSPSCMSNTLSPSQLQGIHTSPSTVLNSVLPTYHHNVGSAPTGNMSIWDIHHSYKGGSLGHTGFSGSPLHQQGFASPSHNRFSQVGGNFIENSFSSTHVGLPSPQQNHRMFHGFLSPLIPAPTNFESPVDRIRSRRSDSSSNQVDNKKQYELDIERIVHGEDKRTTLMIKNIPNKYTSKMLLATIDENHRGAYDFIYLPIDFKNKCNVGYAFINMVDPQQIIPFYKAFNGKKWEKFNSEKVASLAYARIQGKTALVAHFQNSSLMNEDKRCRPILFHSDGPNAGDQEPFPLGMSIRSRSGRARTQNNEDNPHDSPSDSISGDDSSGGSNSSTSRCTKDT